MQVPPRPNDTMLGFAPLADIMAPLANKTRNLRAPTSLLRLAPVHGEIEVLAAPRKLPITGTVTGPIILLEQHVELEPVGRWAAFEKLGLVPKQVHGVASKAIVATYKLVGFGVLTLIVTVLVGYIATTAFYFVSSSWITPTVVTASDDKVVALQTELAAQQNQRDKIAADIHEADRAIAAENMFEPSSRRRSAPTAPSRMAALGRIRRARIAARSRRATRSGPPTRNTRRTSSAKR